MEQEVKPKVGEYRLKIIEIIDEAPEVKSFKVETEEDISFYPGQFFMVKFEDNSKLQRAKKYLR